MIARRIVLSATAIAVALGLAACHSKDDTPATDPKAVAAAQTAISSTAWLRQHLPAHTVAYLRIPSPWSMLGGVPNGRPLDAALSTQAHLDAVAAIRDGIGKDKVLADLKLAPALSLLLSDLRSPVEVALVDPVGIPSPASRAVATMTLDFASVDAFNARIASLDKGDTPILPAPLDTEGRGRLASGATLRYDVSQHRLWISQAMRESPGEQTLDQIVADAAKPSQAAAPDTLVALESRIDTSGEGLFGWASVRGLGGVAAAQAGDASLGKLPGDFASKADAVAFGGGTVDGRGTFRIVVHAPQARALTYLTPTAFAPTIKSAGEPRWAMTLSLPSADHYKTFENNLTLDFGPHAAKAYHEALARVGKRYHFDPARYLSWFGPEMLVFSDDAGLFFALHSPDRKAWYDFVKGNASIGWKTGEADVGGTSVHWLTVPGGAADTLPPDADQGTRGLLRLIDRMGSKTWWIEDGDWIVMAKVPQALADRVAAKPDVALDGWFKQRAYPGARTLLGFTATSHGAQRDAYYTYIEFLQALGAVTGSDVNIAALPAAHTLGLPDKGVLGAALEVDADTLGISFTYEQSPVELVGQAGGTGAVATAAILAAIAVPQYQNYTLRAQVAGALTAADPVKEAVARKRLASGRFPANNAAAGLGKPETLGNDYAGAVTVGQGGEIVVSLDGTPPRKADPKLDMGELVLTPRVEEGRVDWSCSGEGIDPKYLPASCRDQPLEP
ncbi:pilin [Luteibacter sp. CQ10]|uniref:pilin n=1 Tax=Luteibacter sp. CQ10 TaxID=2805821 RepID=UPI0034A15AD5